MTLYFRVRCKDRFLTAANDTGPEHEARLFLTGEEASTQAVTIGMNPDEIQPVEVSPIRTILPELVQWNVSDAFEGLESHPTLRRACAFVDLEKFHFHLTYEYRLAGRTLTWQTKSLEFPVFSIAGSYLLQPSSGPVDLKARAFGLEGDEMHARFKTVEAMMRLLDTLKAYATLT